MGIAISSLIKANEVKDEDKSTEKEQLEIMMTLANARLDTFQSELQNMFLDRESTMKLSVPGKRALRFERSVLVDVENTSGKGVENAVDAFLGAADDSVKGFRDGFKSVVKRGLIVILEDSSPGESTDKKFFICTKHNAIIRIDMHIYKYNFRNKGTIGVHKNIFAYILCISVIDHRDITLDELVYSASEYTGDGDSEPGSDFAKYLESITQTYNASKIGDSLPEFGRPHFPGSLKLPSPR